MRDSKIDQKQPVVKEIADLCENHDVEMVVFDDELSPIQIRNLEDQIGNDVMVIDRTMLILDIFALHATTAEGKIQVEMAQLQYSSPRLIGKGRTPEVIEDELSEVAAEVEEAAAELEGEVTE